MIEKKKILVSACLLGTPCRYDGKSKPNERVISLSGKYELIPVCPECDGGLPTPRIPSERVGDLVLMRDGRDVTENYKKGALLSCNLCREMKIDTAILKARSPSCGKDKIYDGTFTGKLTNRSGVTAEMLIDSGVRVLTEEELDDLIILS